MLTPISLLSFHYFIKIDLSKVAYDLIIAKCGNFFSIFVLSDLSVAFALVTFPWMFFSWFTQKHLSDICVPQGPVLGDTVSYISLVFKELPVFFLGKRCFPLGSYNRAP